MAGKKKSETHRDITVISILNPALASCVCMHITDKITKNNKVRT